MSRPQRYEQISTSDDNDHVEGRQNTTILSQQNDTQSHQIPTSPPPSFRSRASSPTQHRHNNLLFSHNDDPLATDQDRALNDAFDSPSDPEDNDDDDDEDDRFEDASDGSRRDRQRLITTNSITNTTTTNSRHGLTGSGNEDERSVERRPVSLPAFQPSPFLVYGGGNGNDGVFSNLAAKPTRGEVEDEKPPSYEAAAADATPPYWENTILAPGMMSDEVYVDGLPVGSVFSFLWNAMISMSFQVVGFLLTYLLHTTHAAKNGSRAGLGFTLFSYGWSMKTSNYSSGGGPSSPADPSADYLDSTPLDPNEHDFDPTGAVGAMDSMLGEPTVGGFTSSDWFAYTLMVIGWFIIIRSVAEFYRARRHEQLVLQSPERGLGVAVVAEGEAPETSV